jgi:tRNA modification GTPase
MGEGADRSADKEPMVRHGRQRMHMENAVGYLEAFVRCVQGDEGTVDVVLGAEELRYAAKEIGSISRVVSVDDILDSLFHDFCIGK